MNLFEDLPVQSEQELFTDLLVRPGVRIERIVSTGQSTPDNEIYDQDHDEWVLLLKGGAELWIEGEGERSLLPGDHLLIPAYVKHRVIRTSVAEPTIWLAIHFEPFATGSRMTGGY